MKAGPELDAMVAEKVMGWTRCDDPSHGKECSFWWDEDGMGQGRFEFSTDIAAAWEVVEKINKTKTVFYLEVRNTIGAGMRVRLSFTDTVIMGTENEWGEIERQGEVIAETLPLAICLAALRAVGVEVKA